jgi:quercetin dioxygenase-like cupin family protein
VGQRATEPGEGPAVDPKVFLDDLARREWIPAPPGARGITQKILSGKAFCPGFMAALSRVAPGGEFPAHTHDYVHVFYVLEGQGTFLLAGQEIRGGQGTVVRVPPGMAHAYHNPGPGELLLLVINSPATR